MKNNLFKKLGRNAEPDDLDEGYNDDYYGTAYRNDYSTQPLRRKRRLSSILRLRTAMRDAVLLRTSWTARLSWSTSASWTARLLCGCLTMSWAPCRRWTAK